MSRKQIRLLAWRFRKAFLLHGRQYIDIGSFLEFLLPIKGYTYDIRSEKEMGPNHGRADTEKKIIELREDIYERALDGHGRDRMTVVHEFAHVVLHKPDLMRPRRAFRDPETCRDPEWQAKAFAGEFLIPWQLVGDLKSVSEVACAFGVSRDAAKLQCKLYERDGLIKKGQIKDLAF